MTAPTAPRFTVDGWDPSYGNAFDIDDTALVESTARVEVNIEMPEAQWAPVAPGSASWTPGAVLFVDGVRRIDARVWLDPTDTGQMPTLSICASIAAGVVCCCPGRAHVASSVQQRLLVTTSLDAQNLVTGAATWHALTTPAGTDTALLVLLSQAVQRRLGDIEVLTALDARSALDEHGLTGEDLLVVDGPLRNRTHLPRSLGFIKTHRSEYLPPALNSVVGALAPGERSPVFLLGSSWDRHTWYLRLPTGSRAPWAGIVRIECSADLPLREVLDLAALSQQLLRGHASAEFRDPRAPQNLTPIGGLEGKLRHMLGDQRVLYRALQAGSR